MTVNRHQPNPALLRGPVAALFLVLLCLAARGQEGGQPATVPGAVSLGGGEKQSETISKCLADLASDHAELRLGAVMILGKYPKDSAARNGLIKALRDVDKRVRRGAVVSLGDTEIFILPQSAKALLGALGDPDVQTRRLVSSMLPRIIPSLPRQVVTAGSGSTRSYQRLFMGSDADILCRAFTDADSLVRKNMLAVESMLQDAVPADCIVHLLNDPDPETRAMAIAALQRRMDLKKWLASTGALVRDPVAAVRRALAVAAAADRNPAAAKMLQELALDSDITVQATAVQGLFQLGIPVGRDRFLTLINAPDIGTSVACRLIDLWPVKDSETRETARGLTRHKRPAFRASALTAFASVRGELALRSRELLPFLDDTDSTVRRNAQRLLMTKNDLSAEHLEDLTASPYPDVRLFALTVSRTLPGHVGNKLLEELLLDDNPQVRKQVLTEYGRRRHPEALEILGASLEDSHADIRSTAAMVLLQMQTPAARRILTDAVKNTSDEAFKQTLINYILMMKQAEATRRARGGQPD